MLLIYEEINAKVVELVDRESRELIEASVIETNLRRRSLIKGAGDVEKLFSFKLNGRQVSVSAPPPYTLLEALRENLDVTGPKEDSGKGECGTCTVLTNAEHVSYRYM